MGRRDDNILELGMRLHSLVRLIKHFKNDGMMHFKEMHFTVCGFLPQFKRKKRKINFPGDSNTEEGTQCPFL